MKNDKIVVTGAREHNLKNVNVTIPRDKLVVITGLSGSGKSSLAFDTIYADGQRRYVESLSAYARQFLEMMAKPDVDSIEGLSPAISIEQKTTSKNPRSTVGTVTEIYDYLRLLFARVGIPYSPTTGQPIESMSISSIVDNILNLGEETKLMLLSPIVRGRKGEYKKEFVTLQRKGFARVKIDGNIHEIDEVPELDKNIKHTIEVVVDRIIVKEEAKQRIASSVETALNLSDGIIVVEEASNSNRRHIFSSKFSCPESGFSIEEIEPRIFSFNSPFGACTVCDGLGKSKAFSQDLIVEDENLSLSEGAITPWERSQNKLYHQTLVSIANHYDVDMTTPWEFLDDKFKSTILYGTKDTIKFDYDDGIKSFSTEKPFEGVIPNMERKYREANQATKEDLEKYQDEVKCSECSGHRLKLESLSVKIASLHIGEVSSMSISKALKWFKELPENLSKQQNLIGEKIIKEISDRLQFLDNVGLSYLSLSRKSGTLSGGESQRIRLASQIGSGLTGVLYVLDEPSIGLHQRDNDKLLDTLKTLRDQGNTVLVVEHDEDAIKSADYVIDIGPGAGVNGGKVIAQGSLDKIMKAKDSITAQYLSGEKKIEVPKKRRKGNGKFIELKGARQNNLKNVDLKIPLGTFTCITGVSGSGKSTLTLDTLKSILSRDLMGAKTTPGEYDSISGVHHLDKIIDIDQSPIGRTPRSNPATYTGAFTHIRDWFTALPESKARGYQSGRFSFNAKGGRCEGCQGDGVIKIEMHFLPDVYVECDQCKGKRYNRETLEILNKGKNISDVLDMTIDEAEEFFNAIPTINEKMKTLQEVGLGYIKVGQKATTLSGGEAQRIKLSKELSRRATGRTMYILDEPTTGLHFEDVKNLLKVLHALVENGNTVVVIEHNLDVIKTADWIVDIGPDGGDKGGEIMGSGVPEDIVKIDKSFTAKYLKEYLK
ncbi:MAG: excinuclease ABC subunit UvrA [Alphaproteobacteria bacterium]